MVNFTIEKKFFLITIKVFRWNKKKLFAEFSRHFKSASQTDQQSAYTGKGSMNGSIYDNLPHAMKHSPLLSNISANATTATPTASLELSRKNSSGLLAF